MSSSSLLSDSSDDEGELHEIKVNRKFAKQFEENAKRKELERAKFLNIDEDADDDEDSDEDSDGDDVDNQINTKLDLQVVKIINKIRKKDPSIYQQSSVWFEDENDSSNDSDDSEENSEKKKSDPKKTFKDVIREQILEDVALDTDDNLNKRKLRNNSNNDNQSNITKSKLSYNEEQTNLRQELLKSLNDTSSSNIKSIKKNKSKNDHESQDNDDDDDEDDIFLKVKSKSQKELDQDEEELQSALQEMKKLNPNPNKTEELFKDDFLTDYLTKKKWIDKSNISKYDHHTEEESSDDGIDDEEAELDRVDRFESKYNFRFEELQNNVDIDIDDSAENEFSSNAMMYQVQGHRRQIQDSVRRVDDSRKIQRENRLERKAREKRQKQEELKRLKNLKKQELMSRFKKITEVGGLKDINSAVAGLDPSALDDEWDPEEHERLMQAQFGDSYYNDEEDSEWLEHVKQKDTTQGLVIDDETGDDYMFDNEDYDGDYNNDDEENMEDIDDVTQLAAYESKSNKIQSQSNQNKKNKSVSDTTAGVSDMLEELYQLDYEDIIAGVPCRFKYRKVEPDSYGLEVDDILNAEDIELNQYVSLKKLAPYNHKKSKDYSVDQGDDNNEDNNVSNSTSKLSKRRKRLRLAIRERMEKEAIATQPQQQNNKTKLVSDNDNNDVHDVPIDEMNGSTDAKNKRRKRRRKSATGNDQHQNDINDNCDDIDITSDTKTIINQDEPMDKISTKTSNYDNNDKKNKNLKKHKKKLTPEQEEQKRRLALYK